MDHYRRLRHARDAPLAVKLHDLGGDQRVGHAHVVLLALHEPAARGRVGVGGGGLGVGDGVLGRRRVDLLLGGLEHVAQDGVVLAERVDERLGADHRCGGVVGPLRAVGLARGLVGLQVAEALALPPQAGRDCGVVHHRVGRRRRVRVGDVRKARLCAALLVCQGYWGGIDVAIFGV